MFSIEDTRDINLTFIQRISVKTPSYRSILAANEPTLSAKLILLVILGTRFKFDAHHDTMISFSSSRNRAPHLARPKIHGRTLIAERPHINYGSAILIRSDLKVKDISVWEQDNVELISIEMPGVVVHFVYIPPNEMFVLPALGHGNLPHIVIGDFNSHSTTWGLGIHQHRRQCRSG